MNEKKSSKNTPASTIADAQDIQSASADALSDRIQLLVDNELNEVERRQLFELLEGTKDGWKKCAVAFCNEQFLKQEFACLDSDPGSQTAHKPVLLRNRGHSANRVTPYSLLAMVAFLMIGLGIGKFLQFQSPSVTDESVAIAEQASVRSMVQEARELVQAAPSPGTLPVDLPVTRLFELENTEARVVYLSPDPLPEFILQSIVFAGHDVEVARENIDTPITRDRSIPLPIYELRVTKNQQYPLVAKTY